MPTLLNNNQSTEQLQFGRLVERGTAADTGIDWAAINPVLADPDEWHGASINSGAIAPAKALALIAAAERTAESNRGADVVAYQFPGCGWRWTYLTHNMFKVLRAVHKFEGITSNSAATSPCKVRRSRCGTSQARMIKISRPASSA